MTFEKLDPHILTTWRIRLLFGAVVPFMLSVLSISRIGALWGIFAIGWIAALLFFYFFYFPARYRNYTYAYNQQYLMIRSGVVNTRIRAIPLVSIQYVSMTAPSWQKKRIATIRIFSAGSIARISGLTPDAAAQLQNIILLSPGGDLDV